MTNYERPNNLRRKLQDLERRIYAVERRATGSSSGDNQSGNIILGPDSSISTGIEVSDGNVIPGRILADGVHGLNTEETSVVYGATSPVGGISSVTLTRTVSPPPWANTADVLLIASVQDTDATAIGIHTHVSAKTVDGAPFLGWGEAIGSTAHQMTMSGVRRIGSGDPFQVGNLQTGLELRVSARNDPNGSGANHNWFIILNAVISWRYDENWPSSPGGSNTG